MKEAAARIQVSLTSLVLNIRQFENSCASRGTDTDTDEDTDSHDLPIVLVLVGSHLIMKIPTIVRFLNWNNSDYSLFLAFQLMWVRENFESAIIPNLLFKYLQYFTAYYSKNLAKHSTHNTLVVTADQKFCKRQEPTRIHIIKKIFGLISIYYIFSCKMQYSNWIC